MKAFLFWGSKVNYHLTSDGPKICRARLAKCPYSENQHFLNKGEADATFLKILEENPMFSTMKRQSVAPSSLGFHCDSDCWKEFGGDKGLINELMKISKAKTFWFVNADWATEENLVDIPISKLSEIHPIQNYVNPDYVSQIVETGNDSANGERKFFESHPTIFKFHGKWFIWQGTHRMVAANISGKETIRGWMLDLDSL